MVHGLLRKIFPEPQKRHLATMREEIAAIEFGFDRFVRVLLRIVLRDGVTVAVVTPADSAFGVCNHIEAIEEYIRDNYVPAGQSLVLIEHDPPNNISLDDSFSLVRTGYTSHLFDSDWRWKSISRSEVATYLGMPLPNFTYARVPSHQYLEKIFPLHHQLMFVVNNLVGSLGKPVYLCPDDSWRTDPSKRSREDVFAPLESFEARLSHLEIHVTANGLRPGKELPREKRKSMTQYVLLEEKEFAHWFGDLIVPGFYNAWAKRWVLSVPQLSWALVEFFLRQEKRTAAAGPRGASGAKEPRHFVDELTESDLQQLRTTASYCVYGWLHSKPKEEVDPEFVFKATSQSPV